MKVGRVEPESSLASAISVIESNSGITEFKPEIKDVFSKSVNRAARLKKGKALIKRIAAKEGFRNKMLANYDTIINTNIRDLVDLKKLDLTSAFDLKSIDLKSKGLPDPEDYGKTREEVMNLKSVDGTDWPLPKPELAKINPDCFDMDDMYMSSLIDLDGMDMRSWDTPSFDFSFATDWDFPDWMDPSNIPSSSLLDFSDVDLGGIIDLSEVGLPDFELPDFDGPDIDFPSFGGGSSGGSSGSSSDSSSFGGSWTSWDMDWDVDCSPEFDGLTGIFDDMSTDGDLLGMGSLSSMFNGIGCIGASITDICSPGAIGNVLENFSLPDLDLPGLGDLGGLGGLGDLDGMLDGLGGIDGLGDMVKDMLDGDFDLSAIAEKLDIDGFDVSDIMDKVFKYLEPDKPVSLPDDPASGAVSNDVKGPVVAAMSYLGNEWWWYDKPTRKYHYDNLSRVSPQLLALLKDEPNYEDICHVAYSLRMYHNRI